MEIGTQVKLTRKFINHWTFSENCAACYEVAGKTSKYNAMEYEQEILLAMFTLMGEPVYGEVKGPGHDKDTVLVFLFHDGCSHWGYYNVEDLRKV